MKSYEGLFIFIPNETAEARQKYFDECEGILKKVGGKFVTKEDGGKRPLGYAIRKFTDGSVLNSEIQLDPAKVSEFRRALELNESILKYMITVKPAADKRKVASKKPGPPSKPSTAGKREPTSAPK